MIDLATTIGANPLHRAGSDANGKAVDSILETVPTVGGDETTRRLREMFRNGQLCFEANVDEGLEADAGEQAPMTVTREDIAPLRESYLRRMRNDQGRGGLGAGQ